MKHVLPLLVLAALLAPAVARAQAIEDYDYENLEFRGVGLEVGPVFPNRVDADVAFGLRLDFGYLGPALRVLPSITFWSSELQQKEVDRLGEQIVEVCLRQQNAPCPGELTLGRVGFSDLAINADAQYEFTDTPLLFTPYLGAGLGIHFLNGYGDFVDNTFIEDFLDAITPSLNLSAGLTVPASPQFEFFGEGRLAMMSDVPHFGVQIGGLWRFAQPLIRGTDVAR